MAADLVRFLLVHTRTPSFKIIGVSGLDQAMIARQHGVAYAICSLDHSMFRFTEIFLALVIPGLYLLTTKIQFYVKEDVPRASFAQMSLTWWLTAAVFLASSLPLFFWAAPKY